MTFINKPINYTFVLYYLLYLIPYLKIYQINFKLKYFQKNMFYLNFYLINPNRKKKTVRAKYR